MIAYTLKQDDDGQWSIRCKGMILGSGLRFDSATKQAHELAHIERMASGRPTCVEVAGTDANIDLPEKAQRAPAATRPSHGRSRMGETINLRSRLSRAHWCGNFSCSEQELIDAVHVTHSTEVGAVGLYLATRHALESFGAPDAACSIMMRMAGRHRP
jgi:hypothetical protein